jgi:hypothetical protein
MVKQPQSNARTSPTPPRPLGKYGSALWASIHGGYCIEDSGGLEMLAQACAALNSAEDYATIIAKDGPVIRTNDVLRDHPLIKHELAARAFVVRTLQRLGLDVEAIKPVGRPGITIGYKG